MPRPVNCRRPCAATRSGCAGSLKSCARLAVGGALKPTVKNWIWTPACATPPIMPAQRWLRAWSVPTDGTPRTQPILPAAGRFVVVHRRLINNKGRVIELIRDSLFLFAEALAVTGDRFALYGFSSRKRQHVRVQRIKSFGERYNAGVRGRINAIKPGYYTRMGAAVRYGARLLGQSSATQRLLLLLTDGKPNDLDHYEGRYGVEDTRMALSESRRAGLHPFCVTIDQEANDYLPYLFGKDGFILIRHPEALPRQLLRLYTRLTA